MPSLCLARDACHENQIRRDVHVAAGAPQEPVAHRAAGEHDLAENIVHLVLARLPDAPAGTRGISMFLVPKVLPEADGTLGERNAVRCASIEKKMGIHGNATCVMNYDGATGWLLGEPHKGMRAMFTMMNNARLSVGTQGVAVADRAYQRAVAFARDRVQGKAIPDAAAGGSGSIIDHADVRRMLMTMKAYTEASRAICLYNAACLDYGRRHPDADTARRRGGLAELLTPISKGFGTDIGVEMSSVGVQIHGGMGVMDELPLERIWRDARIERIWEGTSEIQRHIISRDLLRPLGA